MLLAMLLPPCVYGQLPASRRAQSRRTPRIAIPVQMIFLVVIAAYVVAMALIGGAVLARYMLPAVPLVIILAVSTLAPKAALLARSGRRRCASRSWSRGSGIRPTDSLRKTISLIAITSILHEDAEQFLEARYPMAHVLTAWPASDELARPWLGYITRPVQVVRIEDFSLDEVLSAADFRSHFEVALVFSTKYEPAHPLLDRAREELDRTKAPILRLPSRLAAGSCGADSRRAHRIFGGAQRSVDRGD